LRSVSDAILTAIPNSDAVRGSFGFLLFRQGGIIIAGHPLGWQILFGAVPTTVDETRRLINTTRTDLTELMKVVHEHVDNDTMTTYAKLFIQVQLDRDISKVRYVATAMPVQGTPFSLVMFAPFRPPGNNNNASMG